MVSDNYRNRPRRTPVTAVMRGYSCLLGPRPFMKVSALQRWRHRPRAKSPARRPAPAPHHRFRWWWIALCTLSLIVLFLRYTSANIVREPMVLNQGPADPVFIDSFGPLL